MHEPLSVAANGPALLPAGPYNQEPGIRTRSIVGCCRGIILKRESGPYTQDRRRRDTCTIHCQLLPTDHNLLPEGPYNQGPEEGYVHDPLSVLPTDQNVARGPYNQEPGRRGYVHDLSVVANGSCSAARGPRQPGTGRGGVKRGGFGSARWGPTFGFFFVNVVCFILSSSLDMNLGTIERFAVPLRGDEIGKF
jgi:hypothetical protein